MSNKKFVPPPPLKLADSASLDGDDLSVDDEGDEEILSAKKATSQPKTSKTSIQWDSVKSLQPGTHIVAINMNPVFWSVDKQKVIEYVESLIESCRDDLVEELLDTLQVFQKMKIDYGFRIE